MGVLPKLDRGGTVTLRWLGQGGFVFCSPDNVKWAVDPYLTDYSNRGMRINRLNPPPLTATELCVDAVLISHSHYDHHDPETLMAVAADSDTDFYGACEATTILRSLGVNAQRVHTIAVGDEFLLGSNDSSDVRANAVFAEHSGDPLGFVFTIGRHPKLVRIYVTGDTLLNERLFSPVTDGVDVLCVCINGRGGNMSYKDAVELTGRLAPRVVIPMHFAVMPHNTIDPKIFVAEVHSAGLLVETRVLSVGQITEITF